MSSHMRLLLIDDVISIHILTGFKNATLTSFNIFQKTVEMLTSFASMMSSYSSVFRQRLSFNCTT